MIWLFLAFLAVPLIEIALFVQVGGLIGLFPTLAIVVITAILGTYLVRSQGLLALAKLRESFNELNDPTEPLAHGAMILFAGALLLTPGFFTDAIGFALLVPGFRQATFRWLRTRISIRGVTVHDVNLRRDARSSQKDDAFGDVIDADFQELEPPVKPTHRGTDRTRH